MKSGELRELSRESEIVDAISGKRRTDHKLYFPADIILDETTERDIKKQICDLLECERSE
jgi:HD superfamily phosphohydrolase